MSDQHTSDQSSATTGAVAFVHQEAGLSAPDASTPLGRALAHGLDGRRVLMVARDAESADSVETALRDHGVDVQRLTSGADGLEAERLEDRDGRPEFPTGVVVLADTSQWSDTLDVMRASRAMQATVALVEATNGRSTSDHLLMITPEDAMLSAVDTLNRLMDRVVESGIADDLARLEASGVISPRRRDGPTMSEATLDSLFGDEVIARERAMRHVIVCSDDNLHGAARLAMAGLLPKAGFDHRAANEAHSTGRRANARGTRGDRRIARGGKGRR